MKILVLNCGSSSLKYQLFTCDVGKLPESLAKGLVERIGSAGSVSDHHQAVQKAFEDLSSRNIIAGKDEIAAVGHRVVHGGEQFRQSVILNQQVISQLEEISELAPLHNPVNIQGYRAAQGLFPNIPHVAVFDTAFHATLPAHAYTYGLPYRFMEEEKIRRYGFHGISHRYLWQRYVVNTGKSNHKIITCHLGNGCSITAINAGESVDTSMGFTPLEGLLMGSRAGDLDAGVVLYLMHQKQFSREQIESVLNHESGLKGVSEISQDMRELLKAEEKGNQNAGLAIDIFCYRIRKYIGAYAAAMDGLKGVVFSGGIGEHAWQIRERICSGLKFTGISFDAERNRNLQSGSEGRISRNESSVSAWVIPTNEELMIAEDTAEIFANHHVRAE